MAEVIEGPVKRAKPSDVKPTETTIRRGQLSAAAKAARDEFFAEETNPEFPATPLQRRMQSGRG